MAPPCVHMHVVKLGFYGLMSQWMIDYILKLQSVDASASAS